MPQFYKLPDRDYNLQALREELEALPYVERVVRRRIGDKWVIGVGVTTEDKDELRTAWRIAKDHVVDRLTIEQETRSNVLAQLDDAGDVLSLVNLEDFATLLAAERWRIVEQVLLTLLASGILGQAVAETQGDEAAQGWPRYEKPGVVRRWSEHGSVLSEFRR